MDFIYIFLVAKLQICQTHLMPSTITFLTPVSGNISVIWYTHNRGFKNTLIFKFFGCSLNGRNNLELGTFFLEILKIYFHV